MNNPRLKSGKDPGNTQDKNKKKNQGSNSFDDYLSHSQFNENGLDFDDYDFDFECEYANNATESSNDESINSDDNSLNDQDSDIQDHEEDNLIIVPGGNNNNRNNVPSNKTRPDQNACTISQVGQDRPRHRNDLLSEKTKKFIKDYHSLFTKRKKISKDYVIKIHSEVLVKKHGIKKMMRSEYRNINTYFTNYASSSEKILSILAKEKEYIMENYLKDNF